jgi:hypothetical protein
MRKYNAKELHRLAKATAKKAESGIFLKTLHPRPFLVQSWEVCVGDGRTYMEIVVEAKNGNKFSAIRYL